MTWAKITDNLFGDPRMLAVTPPFCELDEVETVAAMAIQLVYVETLAWSCGQLTDGHIPARSLRRLTAHPTPDKAAAALVNAGLWRVAETGDGWEIIDFAGQQRSRDEVTEERERNNARQLRLRRCKKGLHSLCTDPKWCPALRDKQAGSTNGVPRRAYLAED